MREHGNRGVMALFTVEEICEVLSVRPPAGVTPQDLKQRIRRVVTDSRLVRKGDLFIAFQGERFDAHTFVPKVLAQGAVCAIVQEDYRLPPAPKRTGVPMLLGVRDTLESYQRLATHYRNRFPIPVIALNGMATSHPCGTGMSAVLLGPFVSVLVAAIALLIQALFLAHGVFTTLGGNIFSMRILGSFSGYFVFKIAQRCRLPLFWCGFLAGMVSDIFTYLGTSIELGLLVINTGGSFFKATAEIFGVFMMTSQGVLCIVEGAVVGFVLVFIYKRRPAILFYLGVVKDDTKPMQT